MLEPVYDNLDSFTCWFLYLMQQYGVELTAYPSRTMFNISCG
jgi:hypothetical protein